MVTKGWEPRVFIFTLLLFLFSRSPLAPQERPDSVGITVVGQVVDRVTGSPIENALIRVPELEVHLLSDSAGQSQLRGTRPGVYRMKVTCLGYREEDGGFTVFRQGSFRVALSPIELGPDAEPGRIVGRVSAPETGDPIRDAEVSLVDMGLLRTTNRSGWFEFPEIPPGIHLLRVSLLGRETREDSVFLDDNQLLEINVRLAIEPIPLEGITVTAYPRWLMASGFFRRRGRGYEGRQWTRAELEEVDPMFIQDVISTVPGVRSMGMEGLYGRGRCKLTVFVDDVMMDDRFHLDLLEPRNIEALEVYHGHGKPGEFFWYCGVILVWLTH